MNALLWFHVRSGVRVALRLSALTFALLAGWITLQNAPAGFIAGLAAATFARPLTSVAQGIAGLAFVMAAWAAARLRTGIRDWLRHLPFSEAENRRGLLVALMSAQLPLIVALSLLAILAHAQGLPILAPAIGWAFVVVASAVAALPVKNTFATMPLALASAAYALLDPAPWHLLVSTALLVLTGMIAGPLVHRRGQRAFSARWVRSRPRPWRSGAPWLFHWRIAWRALGVRVLLAQALGMLAVGAGWLLVTNNDLAPDRATGAWRFAGSLACVTCLFSLLTQLAARRPFWALARSFPWSARRRVVEDGLFLMGHTLPVTVAVLAEAGDSFLRIVALLPFLAMRAAGHMRRIPDRQTGAMLFLLEGFLAASILTLLPWTAPLWLAWTVQAVNVAARDERQLKVTRWSELRQAPRGGDASEG